MTEPRDEAVTLNSRVYVNESPKPFPEWKRPRFDPTTHKLGVAIAGGGCRAYCAGVGSLRALHQLEIIDSVGAMSYSSGSAWLATVYHFSQNFPDDENLLGPVTDPQDLTFDFVSSPDSGGAIVASLTDVPFIKDGLEIIAGALIHGEPSMDRVFGRALGKSLFSSFGIDSSERYFTLDQESLDDILKRNPGLSADDFILMRPDRPYCLTGGTFVAPAAGRVPASTDNLWLQCDFTPLYAGVPQTFPGKWPSGNLLGGGWIEPFAFGSKAPVKLRDDDTVDVIRPKLDFSLSTMAGVAGASFGMHLVESHRQYLAPNFDYWSPQNPAESADYDLVDSGILENVAIVNLMRRGFKKIIAFVNSQTPIDPPEHGHCGALRDNSAHGIDGEISRLFGFPTPGQDPQFPDVQVFPKDQLDDLVTGLRKLDQAGEVATYTDSYEIIAGNVFDIEPYAVEVQWVYLTKVKSWCDQLTDSRVRDMLTDTNPKDYMANFPHFCADKQNKGEVLQNSARQVNLLSNLTCWSALQVLDRR